jgi:Protein of unknown function (DUF3833)
MNIESPIVRALVFDPLDFFDGMVDASGMVADFRGRVTRRFTATFDGQRLADDAIRIAEVLTYGDGLKEYRSWQISRLSPDSWRARAEGLAGDGLIRRSDKELAESRWTYDMDIPVNGFSFRFGFEDIMTMVSLDEMVALTPMKKLGLTLGHIASSYRRRG